MLAPSLRSWCVPQWGADACQASCWAGAQARSSQTSCYCPPCTGQGLRQALTQATGSILLDGRGAVYSKKLFHLTSASLGVSKHSKAAHRMLELLTVLRPEAEPGCARRILGISASQMLHHHHLSVLQGRKPSLQLPVILAVRVARLHRQTGRQVGMPAAPPPPATTWSA